MRRRQRRTTGAVMLAVAVVLAACSGGDEQQTVTETGSSKTFCQAASELAAALQSEAWQPGVPVEQGFARTFTGLDDVANSAPPQIAGEADTLRSQLEKFYSALDDIPGADTPADPARQQQIQELVQASNQALAEATPTFQRVAAYVQQNCLGTSLPHITGPSPPR